MNGRQKTITLRDVDQSEEIDSLFVAGYLLAGPFEHLSERLVNSDM